MLSHTQLSTRAFYRHFGSKDELVSAVFLEMARVETLRLRRVMTAAADPIRAVVAWIDGRLDLVLNTEIRADLRQVSLEAQSQTFAAPELVTAAYGEILGPLEEELERGREPRNLSRRRSGNRTPCRFMARVSASIERYWASSDSDLPNLRQRTQRFCLGGLGVPPAVIASMLGTG